MAKMKFVTSFNLLVIYSMVLIASSAPVKDLEEKESRRHDLNKDKESLLKRLQDLENEINGRRSNEELNLKTDDSSNQREEAARSEVKTSTILNSALKRGSIQKAVEDPEAPRDDNEITDNYEPYKEALKRLLDDEVERGHFVDQPFDDNEVGQETVDGVDEEEIGDNELKSMFDDLDIDDLKQLLKAIKQNKQATEEEGEEDDNKLEEEVEEEEEDEAGGFLQDISVEELQKLADDFREKNKAPSSSSQETKEEGEMTDKELNNAIAALVSHVNTADLHRILAAIKARKQEESGEDGKSSSSSQDDSEESSSSEDDSSIERDTSNDRDTERHISEEEVMSSLMDFLAGLTTKELKKTLKAVQMKKLAMKEAAEKVASEYIGNDANNEEADEEEVDSSDNTSSSSSAKEPEPCAIEKRTVLESIEGARLSGTPLLGAEVPNCDDEGFYDAIQCSGSMCYCVDKLGSATEGEAKLWEVESLKCQEQDEPTKNQEDGNAEGEEKLEQVERDLLEMLKQQKRQRTKNELLNM